MAFLDKEKAGWYNQSGIIPILLGLGRKSFSFFERRRKMEDHIAKVLLTEEQIKAKVKELGQKITEDYRGKNLMIIGILKGAVVFLADLVREIRAPLKIDFMAVSSYGRSTRTSGVVRILKDLEGDISNYDVLIVEDIIDTGLTLSYIKENIASRNPASLKICAIFDKPSRRKVKLEADYSGFVVPDEFVVGYGLDFNGLYRNLPYAGVLKPEYYQERDKHENPKPNTGKGK
jgi:hypoxanthine phosphoribosyltransferase